MPRARPRPPAQACLHGDACECYKVTTGTEQTLDELDFARSACAAAQAGDMPRLIKVLDRDARQVHGSGAFGNIPCGRRICLLRLYRECLRLCGIESASHNSAACH